MANERTLSIIKPDAVAGNHIGAIYSRFEQAGLKIVQLKCYNLMMKKQVVLMLSTLSVHFTTT